ncbi:IS3 family transposase, partial [Enterococcus gallinarum]
NSPMENFFGLLKQEIFHGEVYRSLDELKTKIDQYIYYYNHKRIKKKLNWRSPVQFREAVKTAV